MCSFSRFFVLSSMGLLLVFAISSFAVNVPMALNYQGRLTDPGGTPVADASYSVVFTIYDAATAGDSKWTETQSVTTESGIFSVLLGTINSIEDTVFSAPTRYLGIKVGTDPELSPRTMMVTVPYTMRVSTVDGASGGNITSKVSIGTGHTNSGDNSFVAGIGNDVSGNAATVSGGENNQAVDSAATVAGGSDNLAGSRYSSVGGGRYNKARGWYSVVAGGGGFNLADSNSASGSQSFVGGGQGNTASEIGAVVTGGWNNIAAGYNSVVSGGQSNNAAQSLTNVCGGEFNRADVIGSAVGGGVHNAAIGEISFVGGGRSDTASELYSAIVGGSGNKASGEASFIGGGIGNRATGDYSVVVGGGGWSAADSNSAVGNYSTVSGGRKNVAVGIHASIGGGSDNTANGNSASVGGGRYNYARGDYSVIAGGGGATEADSNSALGIYSTISGGRYNTSGGWASTVCGGQQNVAEGSCATVTGGLQNSAVGDYSFAAGRRSKANHNGAFVWGDNTDADFASTGGNQFLIRATGGVGIGTNAPQARLHVKGPGWPRSFGYFDTESSGQDAGLRFYEDGVAKSHVFHNASTNTLILYGDGYSGISITSSGDVGIGTIAPNYKLDVRGSIGNNATLYHSDRRWKRNITTLTNSLDKVQLLRGVSYEWKRQDFSDMNFPEGTQIGLIAQEVEQVLPEVVNTGRDGYKSLDYSKLVALLIEANKEQQEQITSQQDQIDVLKKLVDQLVSGRSQAQYGKK